MFSLAQFPCENAIHFHTVTMVNVFWFDAKQVSNNMTHFNEAPYLIEGGYIFGLQTVYAIIERVGTAQQVPCSVHLAVAAGLL